MQRAILDHLVFGAASLEDGALWLEKKLGVPLAPGGQHLKMGTHNRLLRLGQYTYLELIAIDPASEKPKRPRWFELDKTETRQRLETPKLLTWVARTSNLIDLASKIPYAAGPVSAMTRNSLNWLITIPEDGALAGGGTMPTLIEWLGESHPVKSLPERGVKLKTLELLTPQPQETERALTAIGLDQHASNVSIVHDASGPRLRAVLATRTGVVSFDSFDSPD